MKKKRNKWIKQEKNRPKHEIMERINKNDNKRRTTNE